MRIERAGPEDAAAVLAVQLLAFGQVALEYSVDDLPPLRETVETVREAILRHVVLKATEDGLVVGAVRGQVSGATCHVGRLVVRPDHEGRGVATALMHALEEAVGDVARLELFTGDRSERALSLYGRLGYREYDRRPAGPGVDLVYLEKRVP
ncbi:MAG: GNAT family N-acetyltransferase [Coriobacteriia bacterium]